jgi:hypothetical protein
MSKMCKCKGKRGNTKNIERSQNQGERIYFDLSSIGAQILGGSNSWMLIVAFTGVTVQKRRRNLIEKESLR